MSSQSYANITWVTFLVRLRFCRIELVLKNKECELAMYITGQKCLIYSAKPMMPHSFKLYILPYQTVFKSKVSNNGVKRTQRKLHKTPIFSWPKANIALFILDRKQYLVSVEYNLCILITVLAAEY